MFLINPCTYEDIQPLIAKASKERIGISPDTLFYGIKEDENLIAFCGVVPKKGYVLFKNLYVIPEYRKRGIGQALYLHQIKIGEQKGFTLAKAYCTPSGAKLLKALGARVLKEFKNSTFVAIDLGQK
jgi:GNAT superfamily N-acetyltransferase